MSSGPREKSARERRKHPWPAPAHQRLRLRGETHWRPGTMPSAFRSRGRESRPTRPPRDPLSLSLVSYFFLSFFLLFFPFFFPFLPLFIHHGAQRDLEATRATKSSTPGLMKSGLMVPVRVLSPRGIYWGNQKLVLGEGEAGGGGGTDVRYGRTRIFSPCSGNSRVRVFFGSAVRVINSESKNLLSFFLVDEKKGLAIFLKCE